MVLKYLSSISKAQRGTEDGTKAYPILSGGCGGRQLHQSCAEADDCPAAFVEADQGSGGGARNRTVYPQEPRTQPDRGRQPFRQDTKLGKAGKLVNWEHVGRADIGMARYISSAGSNMFWGFQIECGWGAYYRWKWIEDRLQVFAGPYLEGCFAARYHANNVNKPLSFDVAIDAMAMGGLSWSFYGKKTSYRLQYTVRTNLIGFDYLPEYGESYYEITEGVPAVARCSGHWNHHTVEHDLSLDLQFPHTTWRIGAEHYFVYYNTKYMHFMRNQICLVVGCCWKYKTRANARL